ncbi:hypothetical protein PHPALM_28417 [Phytophthora palmivora]|uniref:Uncharacterized protein n=1 Tax=Phytophthora palmivora TaxID=4796 RepID=A0A2P4XA69_9STRA|nr:hypothetical protein PHPALM_28417 [Phytophthora palmivora]
MVAPAGKAPKHQLSAEEKRKLMDLKRRERRIRRANDPAPQRSPSIRIKEALRKENKTKQPTTKNPVVGKGKTTTQQFTSAHGVNSTVQETVASLFSAFGFNFFSVTDPPSNIEANFCYLYSCFSNIQANFDYNYSWPSNIGGNREWCTSNIGANIGYKFYKEKAETY